MIYISSLIPVIATMAPSVSDPVIEAAVRRAATLFCEESGIWRGAVEVDRPASGAYVAEAYMPRGQRISSLVNVTVDGKSMALAGDELAIEDVKRTVQTRVALIDGLLVFDAPFQGGETVQAHGTFAPTPDSAQLPDIFSGQWHDGLVSGALAELFRYAPTSAQSQQLASHHEARFAAAISRAKSRARSGNTHAVRSVKYGGL